VHARLTESAAAVEAFRGGVASVIPAGALTLLTGRELEQVVAGSRLVDVERLKANTEYDDDVSPEDPHIIAFWEVLRSFSEEEKAAFLRFAWARPTLPPKGVDFPQKFKMQSSVMGEEAASSSAAAAALAAAAATKQDQYLPKAHTCFFSINLPRYSSKEVRFSVWCMLHSCVMIEMLCAR
jgi:hypothetical protein